MFNVGDYIIPESDEDFQRIYQEAIDAEYPIYDKDIKRNQWPVILIFPVNGIVKIIGATDRNAYLKDQLSLEEFIKRMQREPVIKNDYSLI